MSDNPSNWTYWFTFHISLVPVAAHRHTHTNVSLCILLTQCYFQSGLGPSVTGEGVCVEPDVHFSVSLCVVVFFFVCVCLLYGCLIPFSAKILFFRLTTLRCERENPL